MNIADLSPVIDLPRAAKPAVLERLLASARDIASQRPLEDVTIAEVARRAGVSWPTARRYLGSKEKLHALLQSENLDQVPSEPDTRDVILAAAGRVFSRDGYAGATLDDVGAEAGMTKGAVYWHFANKAELFVALVRARVAQRQEGMPERLEAALSMNDAREALTRILSFQMAALKADASLSRLFLEFVVESRDPAIRESVAGAYRQAHGETAGLMQSLRQQGRVSEKSEPEAFAVLWSALLDGLLLLSLVDPQRVDPEVLAPQMVELLWNGMKRRYGGL